MSALVAGVAAVSDALGAWAASWRAFAEHWWAWVAPLSVQLALLALPLWLLDRFWSRRGQATWRALLWSAVLLRVVWPGDVGVFEVPTLERSSAARAGGAWLGGSAAPVVAARELPGDARTTALGAVSTSGAAAVGVPRSSALLPALAALWAGGALLGLALHRRAARRARARWGAARPLDDTTLTRELRTLAARVGLAHAPRVALHAWLAEPLVDGVLRPVLRLPADFAERRDALGREHVLLHELAHLRRRDPLRAAAQTLLTQLLWFHPCARLASSRLHALREQRCDELAAVHATGGRAAYRRTLLETAAATLLPERASPGLALLGARAPVIERLERLGRAPSRAGWAAAPLLASVALALLPLRDSAPRDTSRAELSPERLAATAVTTRDPFAEVAPTHDTPSRDADTPAPAALAAPTPTAPVPGSATGCFENRFLVMAALARHEAELAAQASSAAPAGRAASTSHEPSRAARSTVHPTSSSLDLETGP